MQQQGSGEFGGGMEENIEKHGEQRIDAYQQRLKELSQTAKQRSVKRVHWMERWEKDSDEHQSMPVGARLLKAQGALAHDMSGGGSLLPLVRDLVVLALVTCALYGAVIGSYSGAQQALYAGLKFPLVVLGSGLICLPSFYVFQCLSGARLSMMQALASILVMTTAAGLILFGSAPISWFFTLSSEAGSWRFLAFLHVVVVLSALAFGIHLLARMRHFLEYRGEGFCSGRVLMFWNVLFLLVVMQMAYFVGPLMGDEGVFMRSERGMFTQAIEKFIGG